MPDPLSAEGSDLPVSASASDDGAPDSSDQTAFQATDPDRMEQEPADSLDPIPPMRSYRMTPMVALGGSAGSIPALQDFFLSMPSDSGLMFVVVLHLSPEHDSTLPDLLGRATAMPVEAAVDGTKVAPDRVYVTPPGTHLTIVDGHLQLKNLGSERGKQVAVDLFFRSLADSHGPLCAAVVFSGADSDGALGVQRIKELGGLTIAQDPKEAEYRSMPHSAMATGMVDWVLPAHEMPARLMQYFLHERRAGGATAPTQSFKLKTIAENETALKEILSFLRVRTGRDFSDYKRATLLQRVVRRVQVNELEDLAAYLRYLRTHQGEVSALLQDLLISVSNFFRDQDAFAALERLVPPLFEEKDANQTIRVWSPACATGEETYSIAMILLEYASALDAPPALQLFGCDLNERAIQRARAGVYPESIAADVSPERLRRFFVKEPHGYRVRRELREIVVFAPHDLLKDPPFLKLDLISCRNLLGYLDPSAKQRALGILHFSCRPQGLLFLGAAESIEAGNAFFEEIDPKCRIYRQRPVAHARPPVGDGASTFRRAMKARITAEGDQIPPARDFESPVSPAFQSEQGAGEVNLSPAELHFRLVERLAPPSVVVNETHDLVHVSEKAGRFLHFASGEPTRDMLRIVHPQLRAALRAALFQADKGKTGIKIASIPVDLDGDRCAVAIQVSPAGELAPGYLLITFEINATKSGTRDGSTAPQLVPQSLVGRLEREIEIMHVRLRDNSERYKASNEGLQASNEELQTMNEELRSASEELETSREELQSINEELVTLNHELKSNVDELALANADLHNLTNATAIPTIFLDRLLRIKRYTPSAINLFNLIPSDIGRPLSDLQRQIDYPELETDAASVIESLAPIEHEVGAAGRWFLARLLPYRTIEDRVGGVVLTFVNITERYEAEARLAQAEERLRLIVESALEHAIISIDPNRRVTSWNRGAEAIFGYTREEIIGHAIDVIFTPEDRADVIPAQEMKEAQRAGRASDTRWMLRKDGSRFWADGAMLPMHLREGAGILIGFVKILRDETSVREAQVALEESRKRLWQALQENEHARSEAEAANKAKDHFLAILSHELRTPLTPVLLATHALSRRTDLPPVAAPALEMIRRNVELEARFIDELLDVTRITRGRLQVSREWVDLHEIVRQAVAVTENDLRKKDQLLSIALEAERHELSGDPARLQQVFWNLLQNASKFTPNGGEVRVVTRANETQIVVEITDSGIGLDPADITKIFDPFIQASHSIAREFGGLGLGLAICKAITEAHDGSIQCQSAGRQQGATFLVTLPIQVSA